MNREREMIRRKIFDKPKEVTQGQSNILKEASLTTEINPEVNPDLLKMFPQDKLERIKAKALRRYKRRQDIQWENYLESMSK